MRSERTDSWTGFLRSLVEVYKFEVEKPKYDFPIPLFSTWVAENKAKTVNNTVLGMDFTLKLLQFYKYKLKLISSQKFKFNLMYFKFPYTIQKHKISF